MRMSAYRITNDTINETNYKGYNTKRYLFYCLFRTIHLKNHLFAIPGLYISDFIAKLVYHWEFIFKKLDINWFSINYTSKRLILLSRLYIRKVVYQLIQDHIYWKTLHYYQNCIFRELYTSLSRIRHIRLLFQKMIYYWVEHLAV